jgi:hypothetical protein
MYPNVRPASVRFNPIHAILPALFLFAPAAGAEEAGETIPEHHSQVWIGYEYIEDASVPGQELTQKSIPLVMTRESDDYAIEVTIPYLQRTAPSGKIAKDHHHESRTASAVVTPRVTNQGLGDITASLQRTLMNEKDSAFSLFVKGEIKFGTADVKQGLGTGMNDYFLEIKTRKTVDAFTVSASIGRAKFGSPGDVSVDDVAESIYFRDIYYGALGGSYQVNEDLKTGVNLEMGQAAQAGGYQQRDLSALAEYKYVPGKTVRLQILKSITPGISSWSVSASLGTEL